MTSIPPGEGAPGWLRPLPPIKPQVAQPYSIEWANPGAQGSFQVAATSTAEAERLALEELHRMGVSHYVDSWDMAVDSFSSLSLSEGRPDGGLKALDLAHLARLEPTKREWAIEGFMPRGEVTFLTGAGAAGKSLLCQQLATAAASGKQSLHLHIANLNAAYITCEDDGAELHRRQAAICKALGVDMAQLAGKLHLMSRRGALDNFLGMTGDGGAFVPAPFFESIAEYTRAHAIGILILDNVAHLFPGNENARNEVTPFVNLLNRLAGETGAAVILVGHPNKTGDEWSGSTAWPNAVRSRLFLEHDVETDFRTLRNPKANYAQKGISTRFIWQAGAFVHEDDLPPDVAADLAATAKAHSENAAFLRCLAAATSRKKAVSENPGVNFYGSVFPAMPEAKGMKRAAFEKAFQRLLALGQIELDAKLWQRENRSWKFGIRAVDKCTDPLHQPAAPTRTELSVNAARTDPPISKDITGGADWPAPPDYDDLEWPDEALGDE